MSDFLTEDTKAIILLCSVLGKDQPEKPLSLSEYSSLVRWLVGKEMCTGDLLQKENISEAALGSGIDKDRLESLLGRGVLLGFAVEEWHRNGIWIISQSDTDYPERYKRCLKDKAPPLLFGAGDRSLLKGGGLCIVGSRNVDQEGEAFTRQVAELCVYNQMPVVSGGARGVDQISMMAAFEAGGVTIGVLADNLLVKSVERGARHAIAEGRLLLVSPYHPTAGFSVGTAMGRNKLIYAMADYGLVVSAEHKKGGTWAGAEEVLKRGILVPVFVRVGKNTSLGNNKLLELGAIPWPDSIDRNSFKEHLSKLTVQAREKANENKETLSLFDFQSTREPTSNKGEQQQENESLTKEAPVDKPENTALESPPSACQPDLPFFSNKPDKPTLDEGIAETSTVKKQIKTRKKGNSTKS